MGIPVGGSRLDGSADFIPGFKTATLQGQRTQHFPPGFDQVQIGGILGLKDKFPARVSQTEQQHIGGAMRAEIIDDGVDPLNFSGYPGFDLGEKVNPVDGGTPGLFLLA